MSTPERHPCPGPRLLGLQPRKSSHPRLTLGSHPHLLLLGFRDSFCYTHSLVCFERSKVLRGAARVGGRSRWRAARLCTRWSSKLWASGIPAVCRSAWLRSCRSAACVSGSEHAHSVESSAKGGALDSTSAVLMHPARNTCKRRGDVLGRTRCVVHAMEAHAFEAEGTRGNAWEHIARARV